jgi:hypothetical protein
MNNFKKLGIISFIFLALFLIVSLPKIASAEPVATDSENAPIMVASQEATIPLSAKSETNQGEECPYKLRLKAGALFLHRQDNDSRTLVEEFGGAGAELINASDLDLGFDTGMDISLMGQIREFGAELRYFGLQDWSESKTAGSNNAALKYQNTSFGYLSSSEMQIAADYNSQIHNAEFNLHWWPCANDRYHLLMGVRWIRLNERLDIDIDMISDLDRHKITADNRLWGGQVGLEGMLLGKPDQGFSVDGFVKAGYYNNNLSSRMHERFFSGSASVGRDHGTFAGELGIGAQYAFTRNIALGARYQLLWLDSVALAPDQMRKLAPGVLGDVGGGSVDWESVLYHGGWVGLTVSF